MSNKYKYNIWKDFTEGHQFFNYLLQAKFSWTYQNQDEHKAGIFLFFSALRRKYFLMLFYD